jgi:hypothetical protein
MGDGRCRAETMAGIRTKAVLTIIMIPLLLRFVHSSLLLGEGYYRKGVDETGDGRRE